MVGIAFILACSCTVCSAVSAEDAGTLVPVMPEGRLPRFHNTHKKVCCAQFAPDGRTVVTSGEDGTLRFWNAVTAQEMFALKLFEGEVLALPFAFSPDGKNLAACVTPASGVGRYYRWSVGEP